MPTRSLLMACLLLPTIAFANGGPAAWTRDTPRGSIAPVREPHIRLISEDLHIYVEEDGFYRVESRYLLSNPEGSRKVLFGVPVRPENPDLIHQYDEEPPEDAGPPQVSPETCESVTVELPGQQPTVKWKASVFGNEAWCAAEIEVPQSDAVGLVLRYRGELDFVDEEYSKSSLTEYSPRTLVYELSPAGYWAGPVQTVSIVIHGGPWAPFMKMQHPASAKVVNGVATWTLKNVDLSKVPSIIVNFTVSDYLSQRQILQSAHKVPVTLAAKASSTLDEKRYPAANLVDGNPSTAWCASKKDGKQPWFEISIASRQGESRASFESFYILPGYAKDQRTWRANARVTKVRVTPCGAAQPSFDVDVPLSSRFDASAFALDTAGVTDDTLSPVLGDAFESSHAKDAKACVRVTIVTVEPGADVCVSEFGYF